MVFYLSNLKETTIKTFISSDMFYYLFLFIRYFSSNDEIIYSAIKIIRTLILKSNEQPLTKYRKRI